MRYFKLVVFFIFILFLSCDYGGQRSASKKNDIHLPDSENWFSIDSLSTKINNEYKNKSIYFLGQINIDTMERKGRRLINTTIFSIDNHTIKYTSFHKYSEDDDPIQGHSGDFIKGYLEFDGIMTCNQNCTLSHQNTISTCSTKNLNIKIRNSSNLKEGCVFYLGNVKYIVFNSTSFGCGLCGDDLTIVLKILPDKKNINLYLLSNISPGDLMPFSDWCWGDINNDSFPDFYILHHKGNNERDGLYEFIPVTLRNGSMIILDSIPKYKIDLNSKAAARI